MNRMAWMLAYDPIGCLNQCSKSLWNVGKGQDGQASLASRPTKHLGVLLSVRPDGSGRLEWFSSLYTLAIYEEHKINISSFPKWRRITRKEKRRRKKEEQNWRPSSFARLHPSAYILKEIRVPSLLHPSKVVSDLNFWIQMCNGRLIYMQNRYWNWKMRVFS